MIFDFISDFSPNRRVFLDISNTKTNTNTNTQHKTSRIKAKNVYPTEPIPTEYNEPANPDPTKPVHGDERTIFRCQTRTGTK